MKITNDFFDKTTLRWVPLNMEYYCESEAAALANMTDALDKPNVWMVYLEGVDRIKVELDEYGWLTTVAYTVEGVKLYVEI